MQEPTLDNFVVCTRQEPFDEHGCAKIYSIMGVMDHNSDNSIYLWRNYNTFDPEPTPIPDSYIPEHSGYIDCDECNKLGKCCPVDVEARKNYMQRYRFGTKVFAEEYVPKPVDLPDSCEIHFTHDNGGRPYKVYIDRESKKIHIYCLNRNLIYTPKSDSRDYSQTNMARFQTNVEVSLAMNPKCSSESKSRDSEDEEESPYYDQHVGSWDYEKVWVPSGSYLTRDESGDVVQDESTVFKGNTILAYLGIDDQNLASSTNPTHKYLTVNMAVSEFTTDDEIQEYYSVVGNSDVPYPIGIGKKYMFFMADDFVAQPLEKYANLTKSQKSDAYTYYYGHSCCVCHGYECKNSDHDMSQYSNIALPHTQIIKRDW